MCLEYDKCKHGATHQQNMKAKQEFGENVHKKGALGLQLFIDNGLECHVPSIQWEM